MMQSENSLWRILAAVMIAVAGAGTVFGLAGVITSKDPLAVLLIPVVIVPAAIPLVLGVFMLRGHRWALIWLRATILFVLAAGIYLHFELRMEVFGFPPFAIPFITFCIIWFLLSFRCKNV